MKLEESLINKLTESEVDEKYGKYLKNMIAVYDIDDFVKKECGEEYQTYDFKYGAAIFTQNEGTGMGAMVDSEAIGLKLGSVDEEFELGINKDIPEGKIPLMPQYNIKVTLKEILEKGKANPTDFETFFDRRNYNSRCQENFEELMEYLSMIGVLKGTAETSEVYEESKEDEIKGIYNIASDLAVYVYDINYGIDDEVVWALSNDTDNKQTSSINYEYEDEDGNPLDEARPFFMQGDRRIYLDEVMRTDLTESVEKLEEIEGPAELNQNVKQWLLREYPEEEDFIVDMPEDLTFNDVHEKLLNHEDIYETLNVGDSVIREKVFNGLVEATGYDYDYFYYLWLYGPEDERYLKYKK